MLSKDVWNLIFREVPPCTLLPLVTWGPVKRFLQQFGSKEKVETLAAVHWLSQFWTSESIWRNCNHSKVELVAHFCCRLDYLEFDPRPENVDSTLYLVKEKWHFNEPIFAPAAFARRWDAWNHYLYLGYRPTHKDFYVALKCNQIEVVKNIVRYTGIIPSFLVCAQSIAVVNILLGLGFNPQGVDLTYCEHPEVAYYLISLGADPIKPRYKWLNLAFNTKKFDIFWMIRDQIAKFFKILATSPTLPLF